MFFTNNNGCEFLFAVDYFLWRVRIVSSVINSNYSIDKYSKWWRKNKGV